MKKEVKVKYLVYLMEKTTKSIDPLTGAEKIIWLIDFNNYSSMGGLGMAKISKEVVDILQDHYPERLGAAFIINAPYLFEVFFKMISPFLNDVTKEKVNLLKANDFSRLHDVVDLDQLETEFGGTDTYSYNFKKHMEFEIVSDPK